MATTLEERTRRRAEAAESLTSQTGCQNGAQTVARLDDGLTLLRNLLYTRLYNDVQRSFGQDSVLMPLSQDRTEQKTKGEIELFVMSEVLDEVGDGSFCDVPPDWLREWLMDLRLGGKQDQQKVAKRIDSYLGQALPARYLDFSNVLERALAEARHAPLILYQLFPLAVRVTTDLAFGDHFRGAEMRNKQLALLPALADCRACHGRLLEVDDICRECGNPVWTIRWLSQAD